MKKTEIFYLLSKFNYNGVAYTLDYADRHIMIELYHTYFEVISVRPNGIWFSAYHYDNDGALALVNHLYESMKEVAA